MHFTCILKLSITRVLNIIQQVVQMPVPGDSRAGPGEEEVAATCPSQVLVLPFLTELLPGSILAVFLIPEMHLQSLKFMLCLQDYSERESMHHPLLIKDREKTSEDIFQLTTKFQ